MSDTKHTPEPWEFEPVIHSSDWAGHIISRAENGWIICSVRKGRGRTPTPSEVHANGLLITAAPKLLAACKLALGFALTMVQPQEGRAQVIRELDAALQASEGRR